MSIVRGQQKNSVHNNHPGSQAELSASIAALSSNADYAAACNAYLNPGHADNFSNARPLPDGTPGKTFIFKHQWTRTFAVTDVSGSTALAFVSLPSFEYPFMVLDPLTGVSRGIPSSKALIGILPSLYLKENHVYAYRCIGKSMTGINSTAPLDMKGTISSVHKAADVDFGNMTFDEASARTGAYNNKIIQRLPVTQTAVTDLGNATNTVARQGFYVVASHMNHNWTVRDQLWKKITPILSQAVQQGTADQHSQISWTDSVNGTNYFPMDINNPTYRCLSSAPDNTDIAVVCMSGINGLQTYSVKFTVVYEFQLKASSPLYSDAIYRPPADYRLMEALLAYESLRSRMPGGGTLDADQNDWNAIWTGFKKYVSKAGEWGRSLAANFGITDVASGLSAVSKLAPMLMAI